MAALVGRKVLFTPDGASTPIAGARTKTITINNEAIDITSDDDVGFRTLLAEDPALRSISMSVEGITKNGTLIALAAGASGSLIGDYELEFTGIGTITGQFHIGTVELGAIYNEAVTFSATVESSGEFTYTPVTP